MEFDWVMCCDRLVGWVGLWVQSFYFAIGWVGLGQSFGGLGWVRLKKLDPRTSLVSAYNFRKRQSRLCNTDHLNDLE